jgi:membrane associated rhomboid family serine protease
MPAFLVLGLWILLQIFSQISVAGAQSGGVAYMAHIGGFVAGIALILMFGRRAPSREVLPGGISS